MKNITQTEQKEILFEMLKYVDEICKKNNIKYFLSGGTLIGAIRHKGFIPWDDDIDICVPYNDYRKLITILKQDNKYNVHNLYDDEDYYYFFTKLTDKRTILIEDNYNRIKDMGVFLDIFPFFHLPDSIEEYKKLYKKIKKLEKQYFRFYGYEKYYYNKSKIKSIIKAIIFFPQFLLKRKYKKNRQILLDLIEKNDIVQSNYIGNSIPPNSYILRFTKEIFAEMVDAEFEGIKVCVPAGYKEYLTQIYGDYMQLPPENQRVTQHHFKAYWKE